MSNKLSFSRGLGYVGTNADQPPNWTFQERDPSQYDTNFSLGDVWLNTVTQGKWVLTKLAGTNVSKGALATWTVWGATGNGIISITGTDGVAVPGDINDKVYFDTTITGLTITSGAPGFPNTVIFGASGGGNLVTKLQGDAGAAVTADAGHTIHIESTIPALSFTDVGAPPNTLNLNFTGALPGSIMQSLTGTTPTTVYPDPATGNIQIDSAIPGFTVVEDPGNYKLTLTYAGAMPGAFVWQQVPGAAQAMVRMNGYIANNAGMTVCTLPALAAIGDTFAVTGMNNDFGWRVAQKAGQTIYFGEVTTTTGVTGYIQSTKTRDLVYIVCTNTNDSFEVVSSVGNIDYN
jgi:hypothetical protein